MATDGPIAPVSTIVPRDLAVLRGLPLKSAVVRFKRMFLMATVEDLDGNLDAACRELEIGKEYMARMLRECGVDTSRPRKKRPLEAGR